MRACRIFAGIAVVAAASAPMLLVHSGTAEAQRPPVCCSTAPLDSPTSSPHWRLVLAVR